MSLVYQVSILGDEKVIAQKIEHAQKSAEDTIEYRGSIIDLGTAEAIANYLDIYNKTTDDLLRR